MINRDRDERGSILPMTVLLMVVVLTVTAFAVDLGMQRASRSDMQALSSLVALDLARHMEGRTRQEIEADPAWLQARDRSVADNGKTIGTSPVVTPQLGTLDETTGEFTEVSLTQVPTAVKVSAGTTVNRVFISGSGAANRSAVATVDPFMCFSVGGYAASLKDSNSPLLTVFRKALGVDLTVLGSGGIASLDNLEIPLLDLAADLGALTPDELLDTNTTVLRFIEAMANALPNNGDTADAKAVLGLIAAGLNVAAGNTPLRIGDVLGLAAGDGAGLDANVNVLDLLSLPLIAASKGHSVAIDGANIDLGGLAKLGVSVKITEPPQIACGRPGQTVARSAQAELELSGDLLKVVALVTNPKLKVNISLAEAVGELQSIQCQSGSGSRALVDTRSATGTIAVDLGLNVKLLIVPVAGGAKVGPIALATKSQTLELQYQPAPSVELPTASMPSDLGNLGLTSAEVKLYGGLLGALGAILDPIVTGLITPVLSALDSTLTALLNPILEGLGLNIGGADVAAVSQARCDSPKLVG